MIAYFLKGGFGQTHKLSPDIFYYLANFEAYLDKNQISILKPKSRYKYL